MLTSGLSGLVGLPVGESASVVDVHLVPRPRLALTLALNLHKPVVDITGSGQVGNIMPVFNIQNIGP